MLKSQDDWNYWYDRVFGYFYRRVNSRFEAEELTANTLNDFFLTDKIVDNQQAFVWGIARNKFFDYLKEKKKTEPTVNLDNLENQSISEDKYTDYDSFFLEKLETLKKCIKNHLNQVDQEIVDLVINGDFKCSFVANELGLSHSNVRQRLGRSLKKLKENCNTFWN